MFGKGSRHPIKQRWRAERPTVDIGVAEPRDRVEVIPRRVALVAIEPIAGIAGVKLQHHPIAGDFGDDRSSGDGRASCVALLDRALSHRQVRDAKGVDDHEIRVRYQPEHRALHRPQRRLVNVDSIDFFAVGRRDRPGHRGARDLVEQPLTLERR